MSYLDCQPKQKLQSNQQQNLEFGISVNRHCPELHAQFPRKCRRVGEQLKLAKKNL
jgi:hypothetical protein